MAEVLPKEELGINLADDTDETAGQTSDLNLDDDVEETEDETAGADSKDEDQDDDEDDGDKADDKSGPDWESSENPYKQRFADSTREVNEVLLPKTKEVDRLLKENEELNAKLKAEKPEVYDNITLQRQLKENTDRLALLSEKSLLDDFIADTPAARPFRDKLKAQARAFPTEPLAKIWEENFKPVAEAQALVAVDKKTRQKKSGAERSGGSATRDHGDETIGGMALEEFNKLPASKQKEVLINAGVTM